MDCYLGVEAFVEGRAEGWGDDVAEAAGVGLGDEGVVGGEAAEGFDERVVVGRADLLVELDVQDVGVVGGVGDVGGEGGDGVVVARHEVDVHDVHDGLVGRLGRGQGGGEAESERQEQGTAY